jgi:hypothetical protein
MGAIAWLALIIAMITWSIWLGVGFYFTIWLVLNLIIPEPKEEPRPTPKPRLRDYQFKSRGCYPK